MVLERLQQLFTVTVSNPTLENVCVRKTKYMRYAPEDSFTCLEYEKRLVQHYSVLGGVFSWDKEVPTTTHKDPEPKGVGFRRYL